MRGHVSSDIKTDSKCQDGGAGNWDLQRHLFIQSFISPIRLLMKRRRYKVFQIPAVLGWDGDCVWRNVRKIYSNDYLKV